MRHECAEPGCRVLTSNTRCDKHTHGDNSVKLHYRNRAKWDVYHRLYKTSRWLSLRREVLMANPVCVLCNYAAARVADHIIPARIFCADDAEKFWLIENLQSICLLCHATKTAEDTKKYGLTAVLSHQE